jgi:hypothetical protein
VHPFVFFTQLPFAFAAHSFRQKARANNRAAAMLATPIVSYLAGALMRAAPLILTARPATNFTPLLA